MKRILCVVALICAYSGACAMSVEEYVRQRDSANVATFRQTKIYLTGVGAGYIWANEALTQSKLHPLYCQPPPIKADTDFSKIVDDEIGQPYVTTDYPIELLLLAGLKRLYPCN